MKTWTAWEVVRRQVAIGGSVVDAQGRPAAGVRITIASESNEVNELGPRAARAASAAGSRWDELAERVDRTTSREDGSFFFLDLPAGEYTLKSLDARTATHDEKTVSVTWKPDGTVNIAAADLKLSMPRRTGGHPRSRGSVRSG